jgi:hypothetical protein
MGQVHHGSATTTAAIRMALEAAGIQFLNPSETAIGPGVALK